VRSGIANPEKMAGNDRAQGLAELPASIIFACGAARL
jgi:hypothetical protein